MIGNPGSAIKAQVRCGCGDAVEDCMHQACGYPWCRPCGEHHRAPECPVDQQGRALAACGHPWSDVEAPGHGDVCGWWTA